MFDRFKRAVSRFQSHLIRLDGQPVGIAALIVLLFLDVFVLFSIFDGLAGHTRQLTDPSEYFPEHCRNMLIRGSWNDSVQIDKLAVIAATSRNRITRESRVDGDIHPGCAEVNRLLKAIRNAPDLSRDLDRLRQLSNEIKQVQMAQGALDAAYDTRLLEDIAGRTPRGDAQAIERRVGDGMERLNRLAAEHGSLETEIRKAPLIVDLIARIGSRSEADRAAILSDLRSANFWFPVKRLGMEMLFLLPLVLLFWFWNVRSIERNRSFQALVSSHLLVVVFIPVLIKVGELVHDIIPRRLLDQLIAMLESLHLVAVWYYLLIAGAITLALGLIYVFQRRLFSPERLLLRRISRGECQDCGLRLPVGVVACPRCGFNQHSICAHCGEPTLVRAPHCIHCGNSSDASSTGAPQ
ncbi:MAG: zinc ribbon domain-containing protein [Proteobacteria bacterium]|nr:zinc ribbon domain-containing protein [Pseudomonadota bacterium]